MFTGATILVGNLVLFDKSNHTIWQSFDHPTDTLVPGQMINDEIQQQIGVKFPGLTFNIFEVMLIVYFEFSNARFVRFGDDGHLRLYHWEGSWSEEVDLLTGYIVGTRFPVRDGYTDFFPELPVPVRFRPVVPGSGSGPSRSGSPGSDPVASHT
ncbi:hypothetical protein MTR67_032790 [Solanum verrucosum]|uniref:Bulb-type lectin domain-containing protein n=1 Tax=Solanum verrucosum TaxID=315347 RepID=A0AAF0U569_SOLVR|nr:hypothetical protein MTR67_032790 [Solanum verrucosum]